MIGGPRKRVEQNLAYSPRVASGERSWVARTPVSDKDIKLAILQSRARAAHASNVEALKLYFYVGGYISKKTRTAKWGSGAIDALSNRLQVELPGLRGFGAPSLKFMRLFFENWAGVLPIRYLAINELAQLPEIRQMPSDENNGYCRKVGDGIADGVRLEPLVSPC